jgi:hypothetical protein
MGLNTKTTILTSNLTFQFSLTIHEKSSSILPTLHQIISISQILQQQKSHANHPNQKLPFSFAAEETQYSLQGWDPNKTTTYKATP